MNDISTVAKESGLIVKYLASESRKVSVPTHAALRKVHKRMDGESRSQYDKRIDGIRSEFQANMDIAADAIASDKIRKGFAYKSITEKPNGELVYVLTPPEQDNTLAKKRAALAKLQAEIAELETETVTVEA